MVHAEIIVKVEMWTDKKGIQHMEQTPGDDVFELDDPFGDIIPTDGLDQDGYGIVEISPEEIKNIIDSAERDIDTAPEYLNERIKIAKSILEYKTTIMVMGKNGEEKDSGFYRFRLY
jgi:hypothetical protein